MRYTAIGGFYMPRDFSKFKTEPDVSSDLNVFIKERAAIGEPPPLSKPQEAFVKSVLKRHGWLKSKTRQEVLVASRVSRGLYKCASCAELFGPSDVEVDHKCSVVQPGGENSLLDFMRRLFCPKEYLAVLCRRCHRVCTNHDHYS